MAPTWREIEKRLTAIEDRIEPPTPQIAWLELRDDPDRREAELRASGYLSPGRTVQFVTWKATA